MPIFRFWGLINICETQDDASVVFHSYPERPKKERHPPPNTDSDPGHSHHVSVDLGVLKRVVTCRSYH